MTRLWEHVKEVRITQLSHRLFLGEMRDIIVFPQDGGKIDEQIDKFTGKQVHDEDTDVKVQM